MYYYLSIHPSNQPLVALLLTTAQRTSHPATLHARHLTNTAQLFRTVAFCLVCTTHSIAQQMLTACSDVCLQTKRHSLKPTGMISTAIKQKAGENFRTVPILFHSTQKSYIYEAAIFPSSSLPLITEVSKPE